MPSMSIRFAAPTALPNARLQLQISCLRARALREPPTKALLRSPASSLAQLRSKPRAAPPAAPSGSAPPEGSASSAGSDFPEASACNAARALTESPALHCGSSPTASTPSTTALAPGCHRLLLLLPRLRWVRWDPAQAAHPPHQQYCLRLPSAHRSCVPRAAPRACLRPSPGTCHVIARGAPRHKKGMPRQKGMPRHHKGV